MDSTSWLKRKNLLLKKCDCGTEDINFERQTFGGKVKHFFSNILHLNKTRRMPSNLKCFHSTIKIPCEDLIVVPTCRARSAPTGRSKYCQTARNNCKNDYQNSSCVQENCTFQKVCVDDIVYIKKNERCGNQEGCNNIPLLCPLCANTFPNECNLLKTRENKRCTKCTNSFPNECRPSKTRESKRCTTFPNECNLLEIKENKRCTNCESLLGSIIISDTGLCYNCRLAKLQLKKCSRCKERMSSNCTSQIKKCNKCGKPKRESCCQCKKDLCTQLKTRYNSNCLLELVNPEIQMRRCSLDQSRNNAFICEKCNRIIKKCTCKSFPRHKKVVTNGGSNTTIKDYENSSNRVNIGSDENVSDQKRRTSSIDKEFRIVDDDLIERKAATALTSTVARSKTIQSDKSSRNPSNIARKSTNANLSVPSSITPTFSRNLDSTHILPSTPHSVASRHSTRKSSVGSRQSDLPSDNAVNEASIESSVSPPNEIEPSRCPFPIDAEAIIEVLSILEKTTMSISCSLINLLGNTICLYRGNFDNFLQRDQNDSTQGEVDERIEEDES